MHCLETDRIYFSRKIRPAGNFAEALEPWLVETRLSFWPEPRLEVLILLTARLRFSWWLAVEVLLILLSANVEGWKDRRMGGWKDGRLEGWEGWKDGRLEGWKDGKLDGWEGWKGGRLEGWKDAWWEGWKVGRTGLGGLLIRQRLAS